MKRLSCAFCGDHSGDLDRCSECGELFCPQCGTSGREPLCLDCSEREWMMGLANKILVEVRANGDATPGCGTA
jgi:hypothetical protein